MSAPKNYAAYLKEPKARLTVDEASLVQPGAGEVLVKVHAVSIQPVDWKIQDYAFYQGTYPAVIGTDVAGVVEAVGEGVTNVKKGDRVLAHSQSLVTHKNASAAFQHYSVQNSLAVAPIPSFLSFEEASVFPLSLSTAADGLYQPYSLALPFPKPDAPNPEGKGKVLLVWGGASSVGATTIQLAVASGLRVVTTASPANFDLVKSLGASAVSNYKDEKIVEQLVAELEKDGEEFAGVYDAIAENGTVELSAQVAAQVKGGKKFIAATLPPPKDLPEGVSSTQVWAVNPVDKDNGKLAKALYHEFVPAALANGALKVKPDPLVVGKGLESIQAGLDRQKQGVSAQKIVVSIV
ncbi:hypothetical protein JCM6882_003914 [Rhodosporidiobolus microsporus]